MDKALVQKMYEMAGAIKMAEASSRFADAARYSLLLQIKDSKAYRQMDMDWQDFCKEVLGKDHKTIDTEIRLLEEYGEYFLNAITRLRLTKRDLLSLDRGLDENAKAQIKSGTVTLGGRAFKLEEVKDDPEEFQKALSLLAQKADLAEKKEKVHEKEIRHHEKKEAELTHKVGELEKEIAAKEPAVTDKERKQRFEEQLDIAYKHLAEAGKLMNTVMDFALVLSDRELAIKYRGAVKAVTALADNLERKIGEV